MTGEEIRKLLGGYATNTLTESERKALFEAAMDDQELFNALQDEETLKELLADPVTRAQVRQALDQPASRQRGWWSRWWTWAGVAGAVATASVVFVATQSNLVTTAKRETQIASAEKAPATIPPAAELAQNREPEARVLNANPKQAEKKTQLSDQVASLEKDSGAAKPAGAAGAATARDEAANNIAAPSPPPAPAPAAQASPVQQLGQSPQGVSQGAIGGLRQSASEPSVLRLKETPKLAAAITGAAPSNPLLEYSLVRQTAGGAEAPIPIDQLKSGDEVRVRVSPGASGVLALYQSETAGEWKLLSSEPVQANTRYTVPATPIRVQNSESKLRLTLDRGAIQTLADSRLKAKRAESTNSSPVIVEFTLAGK